MLSERYLNIFFVSFIIKLTESGLRGITVKIGEFAKKWNVTIDTIRFYIKSGLLIPSSQSPQFIFGEREDKDMHTITRMKTQNFSLKEIYEYLELRRVSTMLEPESMQAAIELLNFKREELAKQVRALEKICREIDSDMDALLHSKQQPFSETGVPLQALPLLACPRCGAPLALNQASLSSQYVFQGRLDCCCGYRASIENGIIKTGNLYKGNHDQPDLKRELCRQISTEYGVNIQKTMALFHDAFQAIGARNKVFLEGHVNGYYFLYNNLAKMDKDNLYIVVDKFPELLEMYKRYTDYLGLGYNILYIADAEYDWPLRPGCVDVLISFHSESVNSFYFHDSYVHNISRFLSPDVQIVGAISGYHDGAKSLDALRTRSPEGDLLGMCWDRQAKLYKEEGYQYRRIQVGSLRTMEHKKYAFSCHQDGEEFLMGFFRAWKERPGKRLCEDFADRQKGNDL